MFGIGSPVFVTVTNRVMEYVEQKPYLRFITNLFSAKNIVDDTFTTLPASIVDYFHRPLNSIKSSIHFTVEIEENGLLLFLDFLVIRNDMETHTDHTNQYQFSSHYPSCHK